MIARSRLDILATITCVSILVPLSGCLAGEAEKLAIPFPRIGDRVTFVDTLSGATKTYTALGLEDLWLTVGIQVPTLKYRIEGFTENGYTSRVDLYVSLLDDRVFKMVNTCLETGPKGCASLREESFRGKGSPWGYGSSLFQGETLMEGSSFTRSVTVDGETVEERLQVGNVVKEDGKKRVAVHVSTSGEGLWIPPDLPSGLAGDFVLEDGNPYVVRADLNVTVLGVDGRSLQSIRLSLEQREYTPGDGPTPSWKSRPPPPEFPCFSTEGDLERGLPPGTYYNLREFESNFKEFSDYLATSYSKYGNARQQPGFYVATLQMNNGTVERTGDVVEQREVIVRLRYHDGDSTMEFVKVRKLITKPNPLNQPASFSFTVEHSSEPTSLPKSIGMDRPVPWKKVYTSDLPYSLQSGSGQAIEVATINAVPGAQRVSGSPTRIHYEYGFWFRDAGGSELNPTLFDSRTGCVASRVYVEP